MLAAIAQAKHEILLEMYWFQDDRVGLAFRDALVARASAGLVVRVIYDGIGSLGVSGALWDPLERAGAEIVEYGPVTPWHRRFRWDRVEFRDHRKLLVVDGEIGFTGGINIGEAWSPVESGGRAWRDDAIQVEGPSVVEMRAIFYQTWRACGRELPRDVAPLPRRADSGIAMLVNRGGRRRSIRDAYRTAIRHARSRIDIANPYFLPGPLFLASLRKAARRGVEVRILIPGRNDVWLVSMAMGHVIGNLLDHGVRVFAFQDRVLHMKTAVFDVTMAMVGSYNLDPRSNRYNREFNVAVYDRAFAEQVRTSFDEDLAHSVELTTDRWKQRSVLHRICAWFAYPLRQFL